MKVYILWFNEFEANYILGIFETRQEAERWERYFVANPVGGGYIADSMKYYAAMEKSWTDRFEIEESIVGQLHDGIIVDNLKLLELEDKTHE
jgi:drug/metabolite transporter superfamily protein YnfA